MKQDISKSIEACAAHYGEQADAMRTYLIEGEKQALSMTNRGPIRFDAEGNLAQDIQEAYSEYGFYVFEGVLGADELQDIDAELQQLRSTFPSEPNGKLTKDGKPALGADCKSLNLIWSKPLGDPPRGNRVGKWSAPS